MAVRRNEIGASAEQERNDCYRPIISVRDSLENQAVSGVNTLFDDEITINQEKRMYYGICLDIPCASSSNKPASRWIALTL